MGSTSCSFNLFPISLSLSLYPKLQIRSTHFISSAAYTLLQSSNLGERRGTINMIKKKSIYLTNLIICFEIFQAKGWYYVPSINRNPLLYKVKGKNHFIYKHKKLTYLYFQSYRTKRLSN